MTFHGIRRKLSRELAVAIVMGKNMMLLRINPLNTGNEADRRVYEILSKKFEPFDGVFGASDIALGTLESGTSLKNNSWYLSELWNRGRIQKAFDRLDRQLDAKRNKKAVQLRSILMTESDNSKGAPLWKKDKETILISIYNKSIFGPRWQNLIWR